MLNFKEIIPFLDVDSLLWVKKKYEQDHPVVHYFDQKFCLQQLKIIEEAIELSNNVEKYRDIDITKIAKEHYDFNKIDMLLFYQKKKIDLSEYADEMDYKQLYVLGRIVETGNEAFIRFATEKQEDGNYYESKQLELLLNAFRYDIDVVWFSGTERTIEQLEVVFDGFLYEKQNNLKEMSVVKHLLNEKNTPDQLQAIFRAVRYGIDPTPIKDPEIEFRTMCKMVEGMITKDDRQPKIVREIDEFQDERLRLSL